MTRKNRTTKPDTNGNDTLGYTLPSATVCELGAESGEHCTEIAPTETLKKDTLQTDKNQVHAICVHTSGNSHRVQKRHTELGNERISPNDSHQSGQMHTNEFRPPLPNRKHFKIAKYYIGNISLEDSEEDIKRYLNRNGVTPTYFRMVLNRVNDNIQGAQLNIHGDKGHIVEQMDFWPVGTYIRPWKPRSWSGNHKKQMN